MGKSQKRVNRLPKYINYDIRLTVGCVYCGLLFINRKPTVDTALCDPIQLLDGWFACRGCCIRGMQGEFANKNGD